MTPPGRVFARLPLPVAPGDERELNGERYRVETAKVADDLRDAKCVLVLEPADAPEGRSDG